MRKLILPAAVFFLALHATAAEQPAYEKIVDKYCHSRKNWVSAEGAKKAVAAEKAGKLNTDDFLKIWELSCNEKFSFEAASAVKRGEANLAAFLEIAQKPCLQGTKPSYQGALTAATAVAKGRIDLPTFTRLWKDACEFSPALESAKAAKAGALDEKAFHDYYSTLFDRCIGLAHGKGSEAKNLALGVKDGSINRAVFFKSFAKSCSYSKALGRAQQNGSRAPSYLEPAVVEGEEEGAGSAN